MPGTILDDVFVPMRVIKAGKRVVFPAGAKPIGPYSPGIFAGEFLYISGQGARGPANASKSLASRL